MFLHRVLPPPSPLPKSFHAGPPLARRDTLLENRIMTSEVPDSFVKIGSGSSLKPSFQNPKSHSPQGDYQAVRSPTNQLEGGLSRKRVSSQSSIEETRSIISRTVPSVSAESPITKYTTDSPSQICLCQPDPKVPRPRNGIKSDFLSIASSDLLCQRLTGASYSLHSLSPTSSSSSGCTTSWPCQS